MRIYMLTANQIKLHPASILPSEKKNNPKNKSLKLVPMLDAASNVCKTLPFASPYRHTAATPMRKAARNECNKRENITRI